MGVITGPLFSLGARGTIANTLTYATWRGIAYVRQRVIPANPQSVDQTEVRTIFSNLVDHFKRGDTISIEPWTANAAGQPYTNRNQFIKSNLANLQGQSDYADFVFSPGNAGGLAPTSVTPTPGAGTLDLAAAAPTLPTGWTITAAQGALFPDDDPGVFTSRSMLGAEDLTSPYVVAFAGLSAATYRWGAWLKWTKPDGSFAYSVSLGGASIVT